LRVRQFRRRFCGGLRFQQAPDLENITHVLHRQHRHGVATRRSYQIPFIHQAQQRLSNRRARAIELARQGMIHDPVVGTNLAYTQTVQSFPIHGLRQIGLVSQLTQARRGA